MRQGLAYLISSKRWLGLFALGASALWSVAVVPAAGQSAQLSAPASAPAARVFTISPDAIAQAQAAATRELSAGIAVRRPAGLEDVSTPKQLKAVIAQAMEDLANSNYHVRDRAYERLAYLGDQAFDAAAQGARSPDLRVRIASLNLLRQRGKRAVPILITLVHAGASEDARWWAADELGDIFDRRATSALMDAIAEPRSMWERIGAWSDRLMGKTPQQLALRAQPHTELKFHALASLGKIRDPRAYQRLADFFSDTQTDVRLRDQAAIAMLRINTPAAMKAFAAVPGLQTAPSPIHDALAYGRVDYTPYWPPELLDLHQLTIDAATLAGERFGPSEIMKLLDGAHSSNPAVSLDCLRALAELRTVSAFSAVTQIAAMGPRGFPALMDIPTPATVRFAVQAAESSDSSTTQQAVAAMGHYGGRWMAPILVALLDDPALRHETKPDARSSSAGLLTQPGEDQALRALGELLARNGLPEAEYHSIQVPTYDLGAEISRVRQWWRSYGDAFLAGKVVPNPRIIAFIDMH